MVKFVIKLVSLYVDSAVHLIIGTFRAEAPGAAPTRQKRGPRPLPIGWRGRLPFWTASPRLAFTVTLFHCRYFLITLPTLQLKMRAIPSVEMSLALAVAPRLARCRAMVRLGQMAMAAVLRPPGQSAAAAAARGSIAPLSGQRGGSTKTQNAPGRSCCEGYEGGRQSPGLRGETGKEEIRPNSTENITPRIAYAASPTVHEEAWINIICIATPHATNAGTKGVLATRGAAARTPTRNRKQHVTRITATRTIGNTTRNVTNGMGEDNVFITIGLLMSRMTEAMKFMSYNKGCVRNTEDVTKEPQIQAGTLYMQPRLEDCLVTELVKNGLRIAKNCSVGLGNNHCKPKDTAYETIRAANIIGFIYHIMLHEVSGKKRISALPETASSASASGSGPRP